MVPPDYICTHQPQCIIGTPEKPPLRSYANGEGLTVNLPNWSRRAEVKLYEAEFSDHKCEDCIDELIVIETGGLYKVYSCGNNLVKFEGFEWWNGEGDFASREQQMVTLLMDL